MSIRSTLALAGLLACALTVSAADATNQAEAKPAVAAAAKPDLFPDAMVATGKNVEVRRSRLDHEVITFKASAAARGQNIPPEQTIMVEQQILQRLLQIQVLLPKATDADKAKGKEVADKRFEEIKKRAGTEEAMSRQLKLVGMSEADLRKRMVEEATAEIVLERELNIKVSADDVKKFYEDNPGKFEQAEMVRAAHILRRTREEAGQEYPADKKETQRKLIEDVLKKARDGGDFAALAKEYSEDPGSKDRGGEYTFGRKQMVPEFETVAFALATNQVSDVVTTQFGYHIIKLYEKLPAKKMEFEKVSSDITDYLKQQQAAKLVPDYMEKCMKEAEVQIVDERLKPSELNIPAPAPGAIPVPAEKPAGKK
jgi:peptidyl-prolyl cis-trans isomerase C